MQQPPYAMPPAQGSPPAKGGTSSTTIIIIIVAVLAVVGVLLVVGIGVMAALGVAGSRKYVASAKEAEGKNTVALIARFATSAADREQASGGHELPPSSSPVPAALSQVSGKKYMSMPSEWTGPGWSELKFSMSDPQYFQYQWERTSPTSGVARAISDIDGDSRPDVTFEVPVTCTKGASLTCAVGTMKETR